MSPPLFTESMRVFSEMLFIPPYIETEFFNERINLKKPSLRILSFGKFGLAFTIAKASSADSAITTKVPRVPASYTNIFHVENSLFKLVPKLGIEPRSPRYKGGMFYPLTLFRLEPAPGFEPGTARYEGAMMSNLHHAGL